MMKVFLSMLIFLIPTTLIAKKVNPTPKKHPNIFVTWGYNRDYFTRSTIHFKGEQYRFALKDVKATDRQSPFAFDTYFNVTKLSIPQYNFCIGIRFPNQYGLSLGIDHMKYVVVQYSSTHISGSIHNNGLFDGEYNNTPMQITPNFLMFEHTNGLNYLHLKLDHQMTLLPKVLKHIAVKADAGINAGVLVPRSDVTLMQYNRHDEFHLAGYGVGVNVGLAAIFYRDIVFRLENKSGYINLPDILTRGTDVSDRASQHFGFTEFYYAIGYQHAF